MDTDGEKPRCRNMVETDLMNRLAQHLLEAVDPAFLSNLSQEQAAEVSLMFSMLYNRRFHLSYNAQSTYNTAVIFPDRRWNGVTGVDNILQVTDDKEYLRYRYEEVRTILHGKFDFTFNDDGIQSIVSFIHRWSNPSASLMLCYMPARR